MAVPAARSAADQPRTAAPAAVATGRVSRRPQARRAAPTASTPANRPKPASPATQPKNFPGSRWPARLPTTAPTHSPTKADERTWCSAGARNASWRRMGARSTTRTSAASSESGPPLLPDRRPRATRKATTSPRTAAPWSRMSARPPRLAEASVTLETVSQITAAPDSTVT